MPNILKKALFLMTAAIMILSIAGCANNSSNDGKTTPSRTKVNVLFWHSMSGNNQEKLMKIVDGFNASQSEVFVKAENQGAYDESTSKFFNMNLGAGSPAVIQIGEQNLQSMIDSGLIESVSGLIKKYNYDQSQLLPPAIQFYSVGGTMYAMPFNTSSPVLFYNVAALKKAGYDKAPGTFEEILNAAKKISSANNGMKAFSKPVYGYALEQMVTNMGGLVVNHENGRTARATEVAYQKDMLTVLSWIQQLVKEDQFVNYGTSQENVNAGFNQGNIAMFVTTSARAAAIIEGAKFEVGIRALPLPEGMEPQGVYAAGGALCVSKNLPEDVQAAAMKFLEYATSAEVQAVWAGGTGYFPVNVNSYKTATMNEIYAKTPQLKVAAEQLLNSKQTNATAGPLLSLLPQLRNDLQTAEEIVFNGGDPKKALDQAVENTNRQIGISNKSIQ